MFLKNTRIGAEVTSSVRLFYRLLPVILSSPSSKYSFNRFNNWQNAVGSRNTKCAVDYLSGNFDGIVLHCTAGVKQYRYRLGVRQTSEDLTRQQCQSDTSNNNDLMMTSCEVRGEAWCVGISNEAEWTCNVTTDDDGVNTVHRQLKVSIPPSA